jgi:hypothetical protein
MEVQIVKHRAMEVLSEDSFEEAMKEVLAGENLAAEALKLGAPALERLLVVAEKGSSGQCKRIARFIGACWNGSRHFDLYDLRAVDRKFSDDMLLVLDLLRWGQIAIERTIANGDKRIEAMLTAWGMCGEDQSGQAILIES